MGRREADRSMDAVGKMPEISTATRLTVASDLVSQNLDDELILLHFGSGMYFGFNDVSARAWQLIGDKGRLCDVLEVLCDEYDVARETLAADLLAFVETLHAKGLVQVDTTET